MWKRVLYCTSVYLDESIDVPYCREVLRDERVETGLQVDDDGLVPLDVVEDIAEVLMREHDVLVVVGVVQLYGSVFIHSCLQ